MKVEWKEVTIRHLDRCLVCRQALAPGTNCWIRSFYNSFLRQWTNWFIGECCDYVIPKSQRRARPVEKRQLSLL